MENQKERRTYEFQKLTPYEKADMEGYEQSLDFVFKKENADLRNIALAGNYGSGKSSIIRTYAENHKNELSFIYVSLAHFGGVSGETAKENYDIDVEKKIINHIVQQIPTKNIPDSGFRIKRSFGIGKGIWLSIRIAVLLFMVVYLTSWDAMHTAQNASVWNWMTEPLVTAILLGIGFVDAMSLIYTVVKGLNAGRKIKALKFHNGSIELSEEKDKSYFDQHLDEILYLLVEAKVDAVVFEDIDRFKEIDLKVLEHLRELCTLANDRIQNMDAKRKPIRFLYLIGDHVFEQHTDRTKFFDYMIPVIPVIDASNSYARMREFLEASGDYKRLNDRFLRGLCLYLDDLRTIKNIVNEFQIYSAKLSKTAKDANQLLALIVYKNIYPDDFSKLQQEDGYLYYVLGKKPDVLELEIGSITSDIEKLKKKLADIESEKLVSVAELDAVKKERQNSPNRFRDYNFNDWNNKIYPGRRELIEAKTNNEDKKIRAALVEQQKELTHVRNCHLSELITDANEAIVFGYEKGRQLKDKSENQLVEFFVKNGYIDETTYRDYIALFYEKGMSYKDKDFLIAVNSHNGKPFDYEIQDLDLVIENLNPDDFIQPETRNFAVVDYILEHGKNEYVRKFIYQLQENTDYEFISQYLRATGNKLQFIMALNKYWTGAIVSLTSKENQAMSLEEIQDYVVCSLAHISEEELDVQNRDNLIALYITEKFTNATCDPEDSDAIGESLTRLDVKFPDIDKQLDLSELRKAVYARNLYILNRNNAESILRHEYGMEPEEIQSRELTAVFTNSEQALFKYVDENISDFIADVVLDNEVILDDKKTSIWVLNNANVSEDLKEQYVKLLSEPFVSLECIEEEQWETLLVCNKVKCSANEVLRFFKKYGLTGALVEYINISDEDIDYASYADDELLDRFFDTSVKNGDLSDDRYGEIVQQIGRPLEAFKIPGLSDEKVNILIEEELIKMNIQNLQFFRQQYPDCICAFVEGDVKGYLALISQPNNFNASEALILIGDSRIDTEDRKKLVDHIPNAISIMNRDYDEEIIGYIFSKKYDINDLPYLIERYRDYSDGIQKIIYKNLRSSVPAIKNNISSIAADKKLLYLIFEDESISNADKNALMDLLITNKDDVDLQMILQKMGFSNMTKLVSGDSSRLPQIKNGADEKAILTTLKKHGFIEDFSVDEDTDTIKVDRKKTIFGGKHGR